MFVIVCRAPAQPVSQCGAVHYELTARRATHAGLISPAPGKKHMQLQTASRQVEAMVLSKMAQREVRCQLKVGDWLGLCGAVGLATCMQGAKRHDVLRCCWVLPATQPKKPPRAIPNPFPQYIILCLEDTSDWNNATTRRTVMQVGGALALWERTWAGVRWGDGSRHSTFAIRPT